MVNEIARARKGVEIIREMGPGRTVNYVREILRQYSVPTIDGSTEWTAAAVRRIAKHYRVKLLDRDN